MSNNNFLRHLCFILMITTMAVVFISIISIVYSRINSTDRYQNLMQHSIKVPSDGEFRAVHQAAAYYERQDNNPDPAAIFHQQRNTKTEVILPSKSKLKEHLNGNINIEGVLYHVERGFKMLPLPHFFCRVEEKDLSTAAHWEIGGLSVHPQTSFSWEADVIRQPWNVREGESSIMRGRWEIDAVYPVDFEILIDLSDVLNDDHWTAAHVTVSYEPRELRRYEESTMSSNVHGRQSAPWGHRSSSLGGRRPQMTPIDYVLRIRPYKNQEPEYIHLIAARHEGEKYHRRALGYRIDLTEPVAVFAGIE